MTSSTRRPSKLAMVAAILLAIGGEYARAQPTGDALNAYTTREKQVIEPLISVFEGLTSVKVNITYLTADPITRLKADAEAGKVDVFIAAELSQLIAAKEANITEPVSNSQLMASVPEDYRDPEGHWIGLTRRLRVVAASRERVKQKEFTYEELADPKWKGKVCARSGLHPYNVMLVASMIAHKGEAGVEAWLRGLKANLAVKPAGGDRDQIANVHHGRCEIALVNTYYVGSLRAAKDKPQEQAAGHAVDIAFPNAADRGAHVSLSGMVLIKDAPGLNNAALLADFMTSEPAQFIYAQDNHEYPVRSGVKASGLVDSWGKPKVDELALSEVTKHLPAAVDLIKKVGFDAGPGS